ncbi:2-amino-4-hydroxy-6-hydroxymethyldihydropteridine diphosphokinase [Hathewaya massiliensis]|uniref:2-amino-4-hydroxy-6- hydroxymethyldihydropteridine diphosphokinase n=1 Tax=Hathewaya massiliensis TaxID=1964382 RepID=UPI00115A0E17|nr:2-amino-4-hydroxy-6-hydroxymethyldihydropteridine diphosphokinase [Hathewaya massiliensis]
MDKITIKDLEVFANHGYFKEEKVLGQKFLISLEVGLDFQKAAKEDDLKETVHYGILCEDVEREFKRETFDLIEKAAQYTVDFILNKYPEIMKIKLEVKKPWAPIGKPLKYAAVSIKRRRSKAYIAMGSNMGDKEENLKRAIKLIGESNHTRIKKTSKFYSTKPVGYIEQDDFLNGALEVETTLSIIELIEFLLSVEKELKRERIIKWGPRTLDLDLLLYGDKISSIEEAVVPHPRMHERMFVIEPLCEIAPYALHPLLNKRVWEIKEELTKK